MRKITTILTCTVLTVTAIFGAISIASANETEISADLQDSTDIVVVGGGGTGMTAALKAKEAGADVILLEKMGVLGGNTAMATTAYYAAGSYTQKEKGLEVSADDMYDWLMSFNNMYPDTCRVVADNSGKAINWLIDIGADLGDVYDNFKHRQADGGAPGITIVSALKSELDKQQIDYRLNSKAEEILLDGKKISGVCVSGPDGEYTINCKAVILAAGGFAANPEMLEKYDHRWAGLGCSSSPGQNGDGILMAQAIGADVVDMDNTDSGAREPCARSFRATLSEF